MEETMNELSYLTTEQLVEALLSRHTFCGILISSPKEVRGRSAHQVWNVQTTGNLEDEQVHDILSEIAMQLGEKIELEKIEG